MIHFCLDESYVVFYSIDLFDRLQNPRYWLELQLPAVRAYFTRMMEY